MNLFLVVMISLLVGAGVYLSLSRDLLRVILGMAILGTAANLVVFYAGNPGSAWSAIISQGMESLPAGAANPLPQALVLTAIVIGFALLSFALVLMVAISKQSGTRDVDAMHSAEPVETQSAEANKPAILELK